jgi:hypothetical protein
MTYNQLVEEIRTILQSNAMIHSVRYATPAEWINYANDPTLPIAMYTIDNGSYDSSYQNTYNVTFWLLDKSGAEAEFETEVISDMHNVGRDIVNALTLSSRQYGVDLPIRWDAVSERYEDFLSGVTFTLTIQTNGKSTFCDFPTT